MANKKKTNFNNPNRKSRSYLQIVYTDSAPADFKQSLETQVNIGKLRYFILSPLHDIDWYNKTDFADYKKREVENRLTDEDLLHPIKQIGDKKKPHYHLIAELAYNNQQCYAEKYLQSITNGTFVKPRENLKGAVRYLAHLDEDPNEKALYNPDEIYTYGDINIDRFLCDEDKSMTALEAWKDIKKLIIENNIYNYADFDDLMDSQDIELQLQFQKNLRLANRTRDYIAAKHYRACHPDGDDYIRTNPEHRHLRLVN